MSIAPFSNKKELVKFARAFLRDHVDAFRKDMAICMTPNVQGQHAYFPALITCIAFADLLSGLYAGNLRRHGRRELERYAGKFMKADYTTDRVRVLYEFLRHKIAHLAYPYPVFDTVTKQDVFHGKPRRRITWTVYASKRRPAIELQDLSTPQFLVRTIRPWSMAYNCRAKISIRSFQIDIIKSIYGPSGYLRHLLTNQAAQERFAACMKDYYPQ
jgi:hypothetical protein